MSCDKIEVADRPDVSLIGRKASQDSIQWAWERLLWEPYHTGAWETVGFIDFPKLQRLNLLSIQHELSQFESASEENRVLSWQERKEVRILLHEYGKTLDIFMDTIYETNKHTE